MAGENEELAKQIYEAELAKIEAERRQRRKLYRRALAITLFVVFVLPGAMLLNWGYTSHWEMVSPPIVPWIFGTASLAVIVIWLLRAGAFPTTDPGLFYLTSLFAITLISGAAFGFFAMANASFDDSAPQIHRVKVHEIYRYRGPSNKMVVDSWQTRGARERLYAPKAVYQAKPHVVIVTTRAGYFGFEWVADIVAAEP